MDRTGLLKPSNLTFNFRSASGLPNLLRPFIPHPQRRNQATYQRTKARLRIKPDPRFLPTPSEPKDHIIYNPPPSAPSVYHTPSIFLPPDDPRRRLIHTSPMPIETSSTSSTSPTQQSSAPWVRRPYQKKYHLAESDLKEMRQLRKSDPDQWSAAKLAKKFECSALFVSLATDGLAGKQKRRQQKLVLDAVKSRWGVKRRRAREDRALRRETWGRFD